MLRSFVCAGYERLVGGSGFGRIRAMDVVRLFEVGGVAVIISGALTSLIVACIRWRNRSAVTSPLAG